MLEATALRAHANGFAKEIKAAKISRASLKAREFMEGNPPAVLELIGPIVAEYGRKKPNEALAKAYFTMFAVGLEELGNHVDRGRDWADELVDDIRGKLFELARDEATPPELLMLLLNSLIDAKIAPGDELTDLFTRVALEPAEGDPVPSPAALADLFDTIVDQVDGNEFDVMTALGEIGNALPAEFRMVALHHVAISDNPMLREMVPLYLLDADPEVREETCRLIGKIASPKLVSPVALRRMITVRNWLPDGERKLLDAAIKACRLKQVDCARWPERAFERIIVSNMDGAGAQSIFAVVKDGRKQLLASVLLKQEVGIPDAWCLRGQSKAEVKALLGQIQSETASHPVNLEFVRMLVSHFIAVARKAGGVPATGFLDVIEAVGIEDLQPSEINTDDLIGHLEGDIGQAAVENVSVVAVLDRSGDFLEEFEFLDSWFEDDAEVHAILSKKSKSRNAARVNAVITSILEPRRAKWAERFLWTAVWLRQEQNLFSPSTDFFIIGRELHLGRPIKNIPIMRRVAETTVMAHEFYA